VPWDSIGAPRLLSRYFHPLPSKPRHARGLLFTPAANSSRKPSLQPRASQRSRVFLARAAEPNAALLGSFATLARPGADQLALELGYPAYYGYYALRSEPGFYRRPYYGYYRGY